MPGDQKKDSTDVEYYKTEWSKDREARRQHHAMMNYHYLMYKGIQLLNYTYSRETLEQMGLHIHVPRTFATIETIRSQTNRPIDIQAKWQNMKSKEKAEAVSHMLTGEWERSHSDNAKNEAEADAFLFGSGYLLGKFTQKKELVPKFEFDNETGEKTSTTEEKTVYEGMKAIHLDPYFVIPDRQAKTWNHDEPNSPRHVWYYTIWDYDKWIEHSKKMGYNTAGVVQGGILDEFDYVRRLVDAIYLQNTYLNLRTRDQGTLVAGNIYELPKIDTSNSVMVLECYEPDKYTIFAGANWTVAHKEDNISPKQEIPIWAIKDYHVPNELEGIGEAEILRWQQYEENKIHNLSYLQLLMNTVQRFAVVEELLKDPTEARMGNPLKNIRMKYMPNVKIGDIVQPLQGTKLEYPQQFLTEVKNIGQSATGITDFNTGASNPSVETLGQSELMASAGNQRIMQKVEEMENRCIVPLLENWMVSIPFFYTDELEYRLNSGLGVVKFLPIDRKMNENAKLVAKYATKNGQHNTNITTVADVFLAMGYKDVVFIDDLLEGYNLVIKTSIAGLLHKDLINQYAQAINYARADNADKAKLNQPLVWDTTDLTADLLRLFDDIISDPNQYRLITNPTSMPTDGTQVPGALTPEGTPVAPIASPAPTAPVGEPVPAPVEGQPTQPISA